MKYLALLLYYLTSPIAWAIILFTISYFVVFRKKTTKYKAIIYSAIFGILAGDIILPELIYFISLLFA